MDWAVPVLSFPAAPQNHSGTGVLPALPAQRLRNSMLLLLCSQMVQEMFYHAYEGYRRHAFPMDELKPLRCCLGSPPGSPLGVPATPPTCTHSEFKKVTKADQKRSEMLPYLNALWAQKRSQDKGLLSRSCDVTSSRNVEAWLSHSLRLLLIFYALCLFRALPPPPPPPPLLLQLRRLKLLRRHGPHSHRVPGRTPGELSTPEHGGRSEGSTRGEGRG